MQAQKVSLLRSESPFEAGCSASQCQHCSVRHLAFCSALAADELTSLEAIMHDFHFAPGETIVAEDDANDSVYSLTHGCIKLYKSLSDGRCQNIGFLLPGDFLGNIHSSGYLYSADAVTEGRLCRFSRTQLQSVFQQYPHLERRLFGIVDNELSLARDQMLLLGRKSARERVASFLMHMYRRAKRSQLPLQPMSLPMTRMDIADYLGLTTESVSRTFTKLRKEGLLALPKANQVMFLMPETLEDMADGLT